MSYRDDMEEFVNKACTLIELKRYDGLNAFVKHYGPKLVDNGIALDRLYAENERLTAIVNLIDLTKERDALKAKVAELEDKIVQGGMIY